MSHEAYLEAKKQAMEAAQNRMGQDLEKYYFGSIDYHGRPYRTPHIPWYRRAWWRTRGAIGRVLLRWANACGEYNETD